MSGGYDLFPEFWKRIAHIRDHEITPNERFWIETIRLASRDTDPAPTLARVQEFRLIFGI